MSRGFAEVEIQAAPRYAFTLITAHLKSRRPVPQADEADLREQEALVLREIIDARLKADPEINLVVLGDFNDVKDARSTRIILGRGRTALVDTRPPNGMGTINRALPSVSPATSLGLTSTERKTPIAASITFFEPRHGQRVDDK